MKQLNHYSHENLAVKHLRQEVVIALPKSNGHQNCKQTVHNAEPKNRLNVSSAELESKSDQASALTKTNTTAREEFSALSFANLFETSV